MKINVRKIDEFFCDKEKLNDIFLYTEWRRREIMCLRGSGLLGSISTVLGPTLPHVGVIITFLIHLNSGTLTPAQVINPI